MLSAEFRVCGRRNDAAGGRAGRRYLRGLGRLCALTIAQAHEALIRLKADRLDGTDVLVLEASR
jgi:hypothetical protein